MEQAVAFMAGVSYLALGLSLLFHWRVWSDWLKRMRTHGHSAAIALGAMHLAIGTFIVAFHWQWTGLPIVLTILGIKAILEGYLYTLFPGILLAMLQWYEPRHRPLLRVGGIITIVFSLLFLYEWQQYLL